LARAFMVTLYSSSQDSRPRTVYPPRKLDRPDLRRANISPKIRKINTLAKIMQDG
jgi:hypothetical protein